MINTRDYGVDYQIKVADYPEFLSYDSFVSCGSHVVYAPGTIASLRLVPIGRLKDADCVGLRSQIINSGAMERWAERLCCDALSGYC